MRKDRKKANLPSLNDLIEKFSQEDVIAVMEKEYQSAPAKLIPSSLIDDTPFIKEVVVPESTIDTFAAGLQEKGFYNPLVVRPKGDRYELILGRKRFLGAKKAGILSLPCAIDEVGDEEELLMLLADTRDQRDTNVVEMALICEALQRDFGYTQQTLAELSHQSRSQITNILRILKLPSSIRQSICLGELSYGHARALASLPEKEMGELLDKIESEKLSVRDVESLVRLEKKGHVTDQQKLLLDAFPSADEVSIQAKSVTFRFADVKAKEKFIKKLLRSKKGS